MITTPPRLHCPLCGRRRDQQPDREQLLEGLVDKLEAELTQARSDLADLRHRVGMLDLEGER